MTVTRDWYRLAAAGIIGVHLLLWGLVMRVGWLYWDDFILQGQAARLGLGSSLLLNNHDGHVMPLTYLAVWAIQETSGLNYALVAATMVVGQVLFVSAAYLATRELLGRTTGGLVALAVLLLSPIMIPGLTWWSAAIALVPMLTCALFATVTFSRYLRAGSWAALLTTFALVVVSLGFFEKSLLIPVWLFLLAVLLNQETSFARAALATLVDRWRLWAAWAALLGLYLVAFAQVAQGRIQMPTGPGQVVELVSRAVFNTIAPGLIGGPGNWTAVDSTASYSDPPFWLIAIATLIVGLVVWLGVRRPGVSRKAWLAAGLYLAADLATFAAGRLGPAGDPGVVQAGRYVATSLIPISIAIGITVVTNESLLGSQRRRSVLAVGAALAAMLMLISTTAYAGIWARNPAQTWVGNARVDLADADGAVPLLDQDVPDFILLPVTNPYNQASWFLAPLPKQPGFADSTPRLQILDNRGQLVPARVQGPRSLPPADGQCYQVEPGESVRIPLESELIAWSHTVALDYEARATGFVTVAIGDGDPVSALAAADQNSLYVRAEGGQSWITVRTTDTSLCVRSVQVGSVVPETVLYGGDVDITDQLSGAQ